MSEGFLFRSEGMWLTWASCLTLAKTGDYALAKVVWGLQYAPPPLEE